MNPAAKLAAFALAITLAFGAGFGLGEVAGPLADDDVPPARPTGWHDGHGGHP